MTLWKSKRVEMKDQTVVAQPLKLPVFACGDACSQHVGTVENYGWQTDRERFTKQNPRHVHLNLHFSKKTRVYSEWREVWCTCSYASSNKQNDFQSHFTPKPHQLEQMSDLFLNLSIHFLSICYTGARKGVRIWFCPSIVHKTTS